MYSNLFMFMFLVLFKIFFLFLKSHICLCCVNWKISFYSMWILCNCIICSRILLHLFISKTKWKPMSIHGKPNLHKPITIWMSFFGDPHFRGQGCVYLFIQACSFNYYSFSIRELYLSDGSFQRSSLRISRLYNHLKQTEHLFSCMREFYFILFFCRTKIICFLMFNKIYS